MKKALSLLMAIVLLLSVVTVFSACGKKKSSRKSKTKTKTSITTTTNINNNVHKEKEINSLSDLDGRVVAVQTATTSYDILKELVDGGTEIEIKDYDKVTSCFSELALDRVDAILVDSIVAAYYLTDKDPDKYEVVWESYDNEPMGICLNKNSTTLADLIEAAIDTLYYNGTMAEIANKHFGSNITSGLRYVPEEPFVSQFLAQEITGGVLKVGVEIGYPPMEYLADDGATYIGFDIDVAKAIGEVLGLEVEFVNTAWDGIFAYLDKGEYDCIISAVSITPERQAKYILTEPYVTNRQQLIVKK